MRYPISRNRRRRHDAAVSLAFDNLEERKLMTATGFEPVIEHPFATETAQLVASSDSAMDQTESQQDLIQRIVNGEQTQGFPAVGYVGPLGCTGTLISPTHVLTAAHCLEGVGNRQALFEVGGQTFASSSVTIHPDYNPFNFGAGNDIAIIELARPVPGIAPMSILRQAPQVGQMLTLVGFGQGGTSTGGYDPNDTGKQVGQTELEFLTNHHIAWNFNSHQEANTAPGDSGGPAFVNVGGQLLIAGVTSGGTGDPHRLGDYSFDTRVDVHAAWIDSIVGGTPGDPGGGGGGGGASDDHSNAPGASATPIQLNDGFGSETGVLETTGDRDAFGFVIDESGETTIALAENGSGLDTYLRVYDAAGRLIGQNDDSGGTLNSRITMQLESGQYYLTAGAFADSETGSYRVAIDHVADMSQGGYHTFVNNTDRIISPYSPNYVYTPIDVSGVQGRITDVNVQVDIDHTWVSDLRLVLVSPDGTRIQLANRVGGSGDDFANTVFDQQADIRIQDGVAPFEGSYRSRRSLDLLNGKNPNGRWWLIVYDFEYFDGGSLNGWKLDIATTQGRGKTRLPVKPVGLRDFGAVQAARGMDRVQVSAQGVGNDLFSSNALSSHQSLSPSLESAWHHWHANHSANAVESGQTSVGQQMVGSMAASHALVDSAFAATDWYWN